MTRKSFSEHRFEPRSSGLVSLTHVTSLPETDVSELSFHQLPTAKVINAFLFSITFLFLIVA